MTDIAGKIEEGLFSGGNAGMNYRFFDSREGVSHGVYASLNVGDRLGDEAVHVEENRRRVKRKIGAGVMVCSRQIHGDEVYIVDRKPTVDLEVDGFDALVTGCFGVALMVQLADCQGILLHDPEKSVIAAIHSGWRGSVANIAGKTVMTMEQSFGTSPGVLHAYISPSLGPCCAEFVNYREELPKKFHAFQTRDAYFNFWDISRMQLIESGLVGKNIRVVEVCTSCNKDYFSYRRACREGDGTTGRQCAVIMLPEEHR